ncbi:hypothetical protein THF5H11_10857 [Vibrio jasicida]|uniref:Uncharacterized protein n=1 Tax=Vibrio jasicida TaxID=766224 RepID=A0AAU9R205_9VIBR|nr:hypothetical protein THF5H11_10857 [Vibrio jasicida]CAH1558911.1 hypothetical protein THF1C08_100158 [Vibrio jasicida]CAH1604053.1 hypothetical protein THF1A12_90157 [Vibrio jasicida]CAH1605415.1 hypothetical protein THF5G08_130112 [Vibrio jasicida]
MFPRKRFIVEQFANISTKTVIIILIKQTIAQRSIKCNHNVSI